MVDEHKKMKSKTIFSILMLLAIFSSACSQSISQPTYKGCTEEAKVCPDGSYVGRSGPNCEFAKCPGEEMSALVTTTAGDLTLNYKNGQATLSGVLQRATPCVDWEVKIGGTRDVPPSSVEFEIFDKNKDVVCVQVLGEPHTITATSSASENTEYIVIFEGQELFFSQLSSGQISRGTIEPTNEDDIWLSKYPDLPIDSLPTKPITVKYLLEHRSALNGNVVTINGFIMGVVTKEQACPPDMGMCGQPHISLEDRDQNSNESYEIIVFLSEEDSTNYKIGQSIELNATVSASRLSLDLNKIY